MKFFKYEALGNDFLLVKGKQQGLSTQRIRKLLDRRLGVGADQLLWVDEKKEPMVRFFNQDGSEAEMCGNGLRAIAHFLAFFEGKIKSVVRTKVGVHTLRQTPRGHFLVQLVKPKMGLQKVLFRRKLQLVEVGNPHAICLVNSIDSLDEITRFGPSIERHGFFKHGTNVEWVFLHSPTKASVRVWERGVGETPACGSGAAAVGACILAQSKQKSCLIQFPGGKLRVHLDPQHCVHLEGPARLVYQGILP